MIEFYAWPTPNGFKISIMLEEVGLPYRVHPIDIGKGDQFDPAFLRISPNNKIPAIVDPEGPGGNSVSVFESGAILIYLAEKTGKLMPRDGAGRYAVLEWLMFQMGGIGPMFGQLGFFHKFAGKEYEDKRPHERYRTESERLLGVLETRLTGRRWLMGDDYTIADVATVGWVRNLIGFYEAREIVRFDKLKAVPAWLERALARPAVQRGLAIPART
jgi:GST-like protein